MKNRKGFTLVELLAVIAILAILVIMALPAVLRMYRQARVNTFENEVKEIYRTAQTQFLNDVLSIGATESLEYGNNPASGKKCNHSLEITGNSQFKYNIVIDVSGKVTAFTASNGTYSYELGDSTIKDTSKGLQIEEITVKPDKAYADAANCTDASNAS